MFHLTYHQSRLHCRVLFRSVSRHWQRRIVTSSFPPSNDTFERPETIALCESSLYNKHVSWKEYASTFFPLNGLHFSSIDIMRSSSLQQSTYDDSSSPTSIIQSLENNLHTDLSNTSTSSAHVVLIAKGPIQCLIAQYFLESLPLAGLVLVDPLILPDDGRLEGVEQHNKVSNRWKSSLLELQSMLEKTNGLYKSIDEQRQPLQPLDDFNILECSLLNALVQSKKECPRELKLESGSIPLLVMYTGDHSYHDHYRICAERTAAFHTCAGQSDHFDQVSVLKVPTEHEDTMKLIYDWYDEVVA